VLASPSKVTFASSGRTTGKLKASRLTVPTMSMLARSTGVAHV
jgi:hypothetical protein